MPKLPLAVLALVESAFYAAFLTYGTEERILVYASTEGKLHPVCPEGRRSRGSVECEVPLAIEREGSVWGLAYDLHSHHVMGAFWSGTDDANERIPGVVFGVFSWQPGRAGWLFRRWDRLAGFQELTREEVVDHG